MKTACYATCYTHIPFCSDNYARERGFVKVTSRATRLISACPPVVGFSKCREMKTADDTVALSGLRGRAERQRAAQALE